MDSEREYFRTHIFPKAQNICKKFSVSITFIDLRWGITSDEQREQKVLHRCLEEIDRSARAPLFFIGLIGNRYGTPFGKKEIESYLKSPDSKYGDWLEEKLSERPVGVTDLEFLYAEDIASKNPEFKPLYYIRFDSYKEGNDKCLLEQVDRILRLPGYVAIDGYKEARDVGSHFLHELEVFLNENFIASSKFKDYDISRNAVFNEVLVEGVKTQAYLDLLSVLGKSKMATSCPIFVQGDAGSGKTFLLTQLKDNVEDDESGSAILGLGNFENPIDRVLKDLGVAVDQEKRKLSLKDKVLILKMILESYDGHISIFIDAVDSRKMEFDPSVPNHDSILRLLGGFQLPEGVDMTVSYQSKCTFKPGFTLDGLSSDDLESFRKSYCDRFGKTIPESVSEIFSNVSLFKIPMAASLVFYQLVHAKCNKEVEDIAAEIKDQCVKTGSNNYGWDELIRGVIESIVKDYPNLSTVDLGERVPALLNDYIDTDGITMVDLAEELGLPEHVVLEVIERLRPSLYIINDQVRSRKASFSGLNENKMVNRIRLLKKHHKNNDDEFLPLLVKNIETYFFWVIGGRSKVEEWIEEYKEDFKDEVRFSYFYRSNFFDFMKSLSYIRYVNAENYINVVDGFCFSGKEEAVIQEVSRNPFFIIEFPLLALSFLSRYGYQVGSGTKDIYEFSLSYQEFLCDRREGLKLSEFNLDCELVAGASVDSFLNFKGFGELVYDTALYKTSISEGFYRFSDFEEKVVAHIENDPHVGYCYGKLMAAQDDYFEREILRKHKSLYEEVFGEKARIRSSDIYIRGRLKNILKAP
jgi:hypothetical protein